MKQWIPNGGQCAASRTLLKKQGALLWAWREPGRFDGDSGWRFLSEHDNQVSLMDEKSMVYVDINQVAKIEPAIAGIYYYPEGADFQFSPYYGKHFVYSDSLDKVEMVTSQADLPFKDSNFRQHFPDFVHAHERRIREEFALSEEEISQLSGLQSEVDHLINVLMGTRTDQPKSLEIYILVGILLGYFKERQAASPLPGDKIHHVIATVIYRRFDLAMAQIKDYLLAYQEAESQEDRMSERQVLRYGRLIYDYFEAKELENAYKEYNALVNHHYKAQLKQKKHL
ncbi:MULTISPECIES: DUF2185 domain-containing protein [Aerococcus]|uniref:DUF2185 domain-containing protein n=1 Tax=Aerococcus sanguinicola TaxID=119206 RepID=A0A5N1GLQ8_9LACT|nr:MULTISPECIES: DUF2185 domain-containing protein [Aerococcus]KAA9301169.1 DUF2185 domain-containing protein [Aerococcus sanguinicola]MDK6369301.1 DUF2185 domain-containing protein [Aerococcus sp. UMB9870]MDK6679125.1 DUF2185 domain-containing protein [Aerococcus sp. UMB8608]MDK6687190.1 DUF2185 domain-containing protein [Aerococcus sp. UMB8623]MDK6941146.1 DUF2185 domain-containing protein [Aerococcus sp. UMB8487]